jgi:hypothetical protein
MQIVALLEVIFTLLQFMCLYSNYMQQLDCVIILKAIIFLHFHKSNPFCKQSTFSFSFFQFSSFATSADASVKNDDNPLLPLFPPIYSNDGGGLFRAKEVIIVCMAIMLLILSMLLFFRQWKKNYSNINQLAYSAEMYPDEEKEEVNI